MDAAQTLLTRYAAQVMQHAWLGASALLLPLAAWRLLPRLPQLQATASRHERALHALCWGVCALWAWQLAWLCDDAFITFRYAQNWASGLGPIWNAGERVEGYTDFLWMSLLSLAIRLGLDPGQCALCLGMAAFLASLYVLERWLARLAPELPVSLRALTTAALGLHYSFASFATSGLETMFAACLVLIALERATAGAWLIAGSAATAAALAHPDHLLFYTGLGLALALDPPTRRAALLRYLAPCLLLLGPYVAWRVSYYGQWFPNTFYAKSADQLYFSQGAVYLATGLLFGGLIWIAPFAAFGAWCARRSLLGRFVLLGVLPYLVYVAKVGGDYMYGRLLISVLPVTYACGALGAHALPRRYQLPALWAFALAALPLSPVPPRQVQLNMSDERTHTPLTSFSPIVVDSPMYRRAQLFRALFARDGAPKPVLADTEIGMLGYYSGLPIIDCYGLTDRHIAHQPIAQRGRPGHEKQAELGYLQQRHVVLSRVSLYPGYEPVTQLSLPTHETYYVGRWEPEVMLALRRVDGLTLPDFPAFLDRYLSHLDAVPLTRVRSHWQEFLQPFYFDANPQDARRSRLEAHLAAR